MYLRARAAAAEDNVAGKRLPVNNKTNERTTKERKKSITMKERRENQHEWRTMYLRAAAAEDDVAGKRFSVVHRSRGNNVGDSLLQRLDRVVAVCVHC
jgi:hypothetical protein